MWYNHSLDLHMELDTTHPASTYEVELGHFQKSRNQSKITNMSVLDPIWVFCSFCMDKANICGTIGGKKKCQHGRMVSPKMNYSIWQLDELL